MCLDEWFSRRHIWRSALQPAVIEFPLKCNNKIETSWMYPREADMAKPYNLSAIWIGESAESTDRVSPSLRGFPNRWTYLGTKYLKLWGEIQTDAFAFFGINEMWISAQWQSVAISGLNGNKLTEPGSLNMLLIKWCNNIIRKRQWVILQSVHVEESNGFITLNTVVMER